MIFHFFSNILCLTNKIFVLESIAFVRAYTKSLRIKNSSVQRAFGDRASRTKKKFDFHLRQSHMS